MKEREMIEELKAVMATFKVYPLTSGYKQGPLRACSRHLKQLCLDLMELCEDVLDGSQAQELDDRCRLVASAKSLAEGLTEARKLLNKVIPQLEDVTSRVMIDGGVEKIEVEEFTAAPDVKLFCEEPAIGTAAHKELYDWYVEVGETRPLRQAVLERLQAGENPPPGTKPFMRAELRIRRRGV